MFADLLAGYRRSLTWTLDHPTLIMIIFVATLGLNVCYCQLVPKGFFPQQDTGVINGGMQGQQDASFASMRKALKQSVDVVKPTPASRTSWVSPAAAAPPTPRISSSHSNH